MAKTTVDQQALRAMGFPDDMIQHIVAMNYYKNNGEPEAAQQYLISFIQKCQQLTAQDPGKFPAVNKLPADIIRKNPDIGFQYYVGYIASKAGDKNSRYYIGTTGLPAFSDNKGKRDTATFDEKSNNNTWLSKADVNSARISDNDQRPDVSVADATRKSSSGWTTLGIESKASGGITRLRQDASKATSAILNGLAIWAEDPVTAANELNKYIAYRNTPEYVNALDMFCTRIGYKANSVPGYKQKFIETAQKQATQDKMDLFNWLKESYPTLQPSIKGTTPKEAANVSNPNINDFIDKNAGVTGNRN
jgi:hypothetical protein